MGKTGATKSVLTTATFALLDVHDAVGAQADAARRALRAVGDAAPSPQAREACERAGDGVRSLLRLLSETALQLSADADEQQRKFGQAGGGW